MADRALSRSPGGLGANFIKRALDRPFPVAVTLNGALQPRQRIVLPTREGFMANVLLHAGQVRTSRPSFTPAMATGGGVS